MEDDLKRRRPQWKSTSMEDNLNGRGPLWTTTSTEETLEGRTTPLKNILMDVNLNGSLTGSR